jgi:hypothetical protein
LRFPGLAQIIIAKKAGEFLDLPNKRVSLTQLMQMAAQGDVEAQAYLLWQAIMGGMPELRKMKFEEAVELREKFLFSDELDDGSRYIKLLEALGETIDASFGADRKKSQERAEKEKKESRVKELEEIYLAKRRAEEKLKAGTGSQPIDTASES